MQRINAVDISVQDRIVSIKYRHNNIEIEFNWKDEPNSLCSFLYFLDKINSCNKNEINCLLSLKSVSGRKPKKIVLHKRGRDATTWRIVFVTLKALDWTNLIKLELK